jgi:nicotinate-nucleotide adenylyltransferase
LSTAALRYVLNLAIFGGTFDPIHCAHLAVARAARDRFGLSRVLLVPAANPPHKQARTTEPYADRLRMVELACENERGLVPSNLEAGRDKSFSIVTIERVRATVASNDRLFFLIGADAFAEVTTWFRWTEVIRAVEFIVVTRPGHAYAAPDGAVVHPLEDVCLPVSSSDIREKLAAGEFVKELPRSVFEYIRERGLYGCPAAKTEPRP